MLSIKQISDKFDIPKSTLYGWEKERTKVFNYLQQSSSNQDTLRELTIILEKYSKTIISDFLLEDIEFILNLNLENNLDDIEKLHTIYIEQTSKDLKQNSEFILSIYQKIQSLNVVERYIFISRIKSIKKQKIKQNELRTAIKHYFKEFLK